MSGRSFTSVTVTTTSSSRTLAGEAVSEARTVTLYALSPSPSAGISKLGRWTNDRTPVMLSMLKSPVSAPVLDHAMVCPSSSRASYSATTRFSIVASYSISMNDGAVWLAALVVISGVSSTLVTVTTTGAVPTPP